MSKSNSIIKKELSTPLRRSPRLLHHQKDQSEAVKLGICKSKSSNNPVRSSNPLLTSTKSDSQPKSRKDDLNREISDKRCRSDNVLRRSPRLNSGVDASMYVRRSPRFSNKQIAKEFVKKSGEILAKRIFEDNLKKRFACDSNKCKRKSEMGVGTCPQREVSGFSVVLGLNAVQEKGGERKEGEAAKGTEETKVNAVQAKGGERKEGEAAKGTEETKVKKKRKRDEKGKETSKIHGWTKEQEVALQRAYFTMKPTPHFWKKVSKLVLCFSLIHFRYGNNLILR